MVSTGLCEGMFNVKCAGCVFRTHAATKLCGETLVSSARNTRDSLWAEFEFLVSVKPETFYCCWNVPYAHLQSHDFKWAPESQFQKLHVVPPEFA